MNLLSNMSIKRKLIFGFGISLFFTLLVGIFGINGISSINHRINDIQRNLIPSITTSAELDHHTQQHRRTFLNYLFEHKNPLLNKELSVRLDREERQTFEEFTVLEALPLLVEEREILSNLKNLLQRYFADSKLIKQQVDAGVSFEQIAEQNKKLYELFGSVEAESKKMRQFNVEEARVHFEAASSSFSIYRLFMFVLVFAAFFIATLIAYVITTGIAKPMRFILNTINLQKEAGEKKAELVEAIAGGDLSKDIEIYEPVCIDEEMVSRDETGELIKAIVLLSKTQNTLDMAFIEMTNFLRHERDMDDIRSWTKNGQNELNSILRGDKNTTQLASEALTFLVEYVGASLGTLYVFNEKESVLIRKAGYALDSENQASHVIKLGEGIAGQAAKEKKIITLDDVPDGYVKISSGLGESRPRFLMVLPLLHNDSILGVVEFASLIRFSEHQIDFLKQVSEWLAIAIAVNTSHQLIGDLLEQTQGQAEELRVQQEELQQTNEELEERAQMLEQQKEQIRAKNRDIEASSLELERKAEELERVSTYKSQFLANMSHELRTPLNSMMILSSLLKDNRESNLTAKQVEFAATINSAGRDLLNLINDILDLSKIEAGKLEYHYEDVSFEEISLQVQAVFVPIAADKDIDFDVTIVPPIPETAFIDSQRVQQILKNLISNAIKFTSKGEVDLRIYSPTPAEIPVALISDSPMVAFAVCDTGIGIPQEKQDMVFNAFQQADGSTSRTYGGTGLGLSISRQLARSMGGEITLQSIPEKGSVFTLFLPIAGAIPLEHHIPAPATVVKEVTPVQKVKTVHKLEANDSLPKAPIPDDRHRLEPGCRSILIIEDDLTFANVLIKIVQGRGFYGIAAIDGESGILLAEQYQPNAIILDVMLPHIDGWGVMRSLKDNPKTRHIPVHFITCLDERQKAMSMGAVGFITKPVSSEELDNVFATLEQAIDKSMKMLLIVEDDKDQASSMVALLETRNVSITVAETGTRAIELLSKDPFDCIVLDLGLADMGAFELLEQLKKHDPARRIPVIIHTGRDLTSSEEKKLRHYAESIIIKGAKSPERLLNEVTLFLHLVETSLEPDKQMMIRKALDKEAMLDGKKVLIVDDDMRNIFSLSSALAEKNMIIFEAENGMEALKILDKEPDVDLVLMDIMMPVMDGYETMRRIKGDDRFTNLPIIALTAKAMKGDREECLDAGASDYIAKPVDMGKLFSLLRVWLYRAD